MRVFFEVLAYFGIALLAALGVIRFHEIWFGGQVLPYYNTGSTVTPYLIGVGISVMVLGVVGEVRYSVKRKSK